MSLEPDRNDAKSFCSFRFYIRNAIADNNFVAFFRFVDWESRIQFRKITVVVRLCNSQFTVVPTSGNFLSMFSFRFIWFRCDKLHQIIAKTICTRQNEQWMSNRLFDTIFLCNFFTATEWRTHWPMRNDTKCIAHQIEYRKYVISCVKRNQLFSSWEDNFFLFVFNISIRIESTEKKNLIWAFLNRSDSITSNAKPINSQRH